MASGLNTSLIYLYATEHLNPSGPPGSKPGKEKKVLVFNALHLWTMLPEYLRSAKTVKSFSIQGLKHSHGFPINLSHNLFLLFNYFFFLACLCFYCLLNSCLTFSSRFTMQLWEHMWIRRERFSFFYMPEQTNLINSTFS